MNTAVESLLTTNQRLAQVSILRPGMGRSSPLAQRAAELSWECFSTEDYRVSPTRGDEKRLPQQLLSMEAPPFPLSSRAKPRDLQFGGPLLGVFFDREVMGLGPTQGDEKHFHERPVEPQIARRL
jgi:hypothetical protein